MGQIFGFDKMMYMNSYRYFKYKDLKFKEFADHIANMMYFRYSRYQLVN